MEATARFGLAVFLTLDDAGIAGQEADFLEFFAKRRLIKRQSLTDPVADRAGLARKAAALDGAYHVEFALAARNVERLIDDHLQYRPGEIFFKFSPVDENLKNILRGLGGRDYGYRRIGFGHARKFDPYRRRRRIRGRLVP